MPETVPIFTRDEFARRGDETYLQQVLPHLPPEADGKFAAVDVVSGAFELDASDYAAVTRLHQRVPDAQVWLVRVGHPAACRIGSAR